MSWERTKAAVIGGGAISAGILYFSGGCEHEPEVRSVVDNKGNTHVIDVDRVDSKGYMLYREGDSDPNGLVADIPNIQAMEARDLKKVRDAIGEEIGVNGMRCEVVGEKEETQESAVAGSVARRTLIKMQVKDIKCFDRAEENIGDYR